MKSTDKLVLVPIDQLIPYVNNARTHSATQINKLRSSLREFGFINPVIIDGDNNIIAGHGRVMAAKEEGFDMVPCIPVNYLSEAQKKAYILADNRFALDAGWDEEMLRTEIEALQEMAYDLANTGFEPAELDDLFAVPEESIKDDEFDVDSELEKPAMSKLGDLWLLGPHRLVVGDSTKPETYDLLMDGKKANLVVTDPPYNVDYEGTAGKIKNDSLENDAFYKLLLDSFTLANKAMADDASIYVFHADTEGLNFRKAFNDAGFYLSGCCIWKKPSLVLGRSPYQWQHEPILFGWKRNGKHNWYSDRKQTTIWEYDKPRHNKDHPTMKPIPLLAHAILNSSLTNCIVLDMFGGSGSTLIACEQSNRICYTVELDEKYSDVIINRYIEQVGNADDVSVLRNGKKHSIEDVRKDDNAS